MTDYLEALMSLPSMIGAYASPDGRWIAWTWVRTAPTTEVYVAPTDGSQAPIRLTDTPENTFFLAWTPDSRAVLVTQDTSGNERECIYRIDLDQPLVMHPLTEVQPNYFLRGGELHPNGQYLVYGANLDPASGNEIEATWILRHDLASGERLVLARPEKGGFTYPLLSPTGEWVLYQRQDLHPGGRQQWLVDINGEHDHEILNVGDAVKTFADWFPDGKRLVILVETPTHRKVGMMTLPDEQIRWLVDDPQRNIESVYVPHGSEHIVIVEVQQAKLMCSLLHPDTGEETSVTTPAGNLRLIAPVNATEWIGVYFSSQQPHDIVRFPLHNPAQFTSLSRVWERTRLTRDELTQAQNFMWQSVDGLTIQGWLYRPQGNARGTVVYVHGGPTSHSQDMINTQIQYFVQQGYNVLDPNYRGSTGFGMQFREAIKADGWGGREQEDIRTGIEALIAAGIAERGKVGITGTSYGGYSSWCAITRFPTDVLAASAPICGMTDLVVDYQTTRPDLRPYSAEMLGGTPDEVPEKYRERSPLHFVDQIKGRLLIIQGLQDPNVTPENVNVVTKALQTNGIEYELLAFEDEGHGIIKPANQKVLLQHLHEFFESAFA